MTMQTQEEIQQVLKEQLENHDVQRALQVSVLAGQYFMLSFAYLTAAMLQVPTDTTTINMSHVIHHMAFGPQYPGQINPLDGMPPGTFNILCLHTCNRWPECRLCCFAKQQAAMHTVLCSQP